MLVTSLALVVTFGPLISTATARPAVEPGDSSSGTGATAPSPGRSSRVVATPPPGNRQCPPTQTTPTVVYPQACILPWLPGWRPQTGVVFNDPLGNKAARAAIVRRVLMAIQHTPKGQLIRISVYSLDRKEILGALRAARARGVRVQVIVNERVMSGGTRKLRKLLGRNPANQSFVIACKGRCRAKGDGGNMHSKVYAFSRTGGARDLVIVGSGNMTSKGVGRQWNDSYGIANDTGLYDSWGKMFVQMSYQTKIGPRSIRYNSPTNAYVAAYYRAVGGSGSATTRVTRPSVRLGKYKPSGDAVVQRMRKVGCRAPAGYGRNGRTVIRITMYAMFKKRGNAIARELARLRRAGCDIRMIMSVPGYDTIKILRGGGIPLRSADWLFAERDPLQEDGIAGYGPRFYSHYKVMALSGTYSGKPTNTVWNGSENWDGLSFSNEEVVLAINNRQTFVAYAKQFNKMWSGMATHQIYSQPTYDPRGRYWPTS